MKVLRELTDALFVRAFLFVLGTMTCPRLSSAMDIQIFDDMAAKDQKEYLTVLVKDAARALIEQGQRDEATRLQELFQQIPPGDHRSVGEAQFEANLARQRTWAVGEVENALTATMYQNGLKLPLRAK
jgi:hypothetical protein